MAFVGTEVYAAGAYTDLSSKRYEAGLGSLYLTRPYLFHFENGSWREVTIPGGAAESPEGVEVTLSATGSVLHVALGMKLGDASRLMSFDGKKWTSRDVPADRIGKISAHEDSVWILGGSGSRMGLLLAQ